VVFQFFAMTAVTWQQSAGADVYNITAPPVSDGVMLLPQLTRLDWSGLEVVFRVRPVKAPVCRTIPLTQLAHRLGLVLLWGL